MLQTREWRRKKRIQKIRAAAALVMLSGALTLATWDFRELDATAEQAREIAKSGDQEAMSGACGVLLRETRKNIDALAAIQAQGGAAGALAAAAIDQLREQVR